MNTEIESLAVLLIGSVPAPLHEAAALVIYLLVIIIIGSALASVVLRNVVFAIASFATTMAAVAVVYLMLAPFLLFAVQLLLFTTISAGLLLGLLRTTTGLEAAPTSPFGSELIGGAAVGAALFALVGVVVGATNWPVRVHGGPMEGLGGTLVDTYVVGLAVLVVLVASAALGAGLLATQRLGRRPPAAASAAAPRRGPRPGRSGTHR